MGPPKRRLRLVVEDGQATQTEAPYTGHTFDDCFRSFHRLVASIGLRMLGRRSDVDDFVQDVFFEVHRSFHTIRDPSATKAFVRAIAVRVAIKKLRRHRLAAAIGLDQPADLGPFPVQANQEHAALLSQVYRALDTLPAKARVVWVLRYIEGEKLEDIAEVSRMGLSSVKRHLTVAKDALAEVFDD